MAKMTFGELDNNKTVEAKVITDETTALAAPVDSSAALAGPIGNFSSAGLDADVALEDVRLPRINVLQKMSELVDEPGYNAGDITFQKEVVVCPFGENLEITFLNLRRQYRENLPWGSDTEARVVNTREEVFAAGGSLKFRAPNEWVPIAHLTCLIKAPANLPEEHEALFPLSFNGDLYAMAIWTVSSSAYTSVASTLMTAVTQFLRDGLWTANWELSVVKKAKDTKVYYVPTIKRRGNHTGDKLDYIKGLLGM